MRGKGRGRGRNSRKREKGKREIGKMLRGETESKRVEVHAAVSMHT